MIPLITLIIAGLMLGSIAAAALLVWFGRWSETLRGRRFRIWCGEEICEQCGSSSVQSEGYEYQRSLYCHDCGHRTRVGAT